MSIPITSPSKRSSSDEEECTLDDGTPSSEKFTMIEEKSRGVQRMEFLSARVGTKYRVLLYTGFTLLAYVMSLDQYTAGTYLTTATSVSFSAHSTLATIRVIKSVFQAVSQPPIAKFADVIGRVEAYCLCVFLYALGYIVAASSNSIYVFAVGNSIYILGITGLFLLQNIIIADISSLRNRLFWSIFPSLPGAINVWVAGNVAAGVLATSSWRWGLGMFCILTPVLAAPIIIILSIGMRAPRSAPFNATDEKTEQVAPSPMSFRQRSTSMFWQLDAVGLLLLVGGVGLVLITVTIANGKVARWSDAHSIAMLVIGALGTLGFVLWERFGARHPLLPFALLKDRTVIGSLLIALFHPCAGGIVGGYFYTFLIVAANQTPLSGTRIAAITSFAGTLTAVFAGVVVRYTRYLKPVIVFGFCLEVLSLGLMIRFRQSTNSQVELAMVQVVRGLGSGCIGFPTQAAIQSASKHEHTAAITAGYLLIYYLAGGVGSAIGGGIWTNLVPNKIDLYMGNSTLAASAYANPVNFIKIYAPGTPPRMAVARAHDETQRIIVIVGVCCAVLGLLSSLLLRNVRLPETQAVGESREEDQTPVKELAISNFLSFKDNRNK